MKRTEAIRRMEAMKRLGVHAAAPAGRKNAWQVVAIVTVAVTLGVAAIIGNLMTPGGDLPRFKSLKKQIDEGKYSPVAGVIRLNSTDRRSTYDGCIYVTGSPPELILFPRWRGEGTTLVATGWSSAALVQGADTKATIPGALDLAGDDLQPRRPPVVNENIRVRKVLGDGWYEFERRRG